VKITENDDKSILDSASQEFDIIKDIDHPNIIKGYKLFRNDMQNAVYQVIKLVDG
jgi:hypothetical protein